MVYRVISGILVFAAASVFGSGVVGVVRTRTKTNNPITLAANIKLEPRKKELWLPWPLDKIRDDYSKFAQDRAANLTVQSTVDEDEEERAARRETSSALSRGFQQLASIYSPRNESNPTDVQQHWSRQAISPLAVARRQRIIGGDEGKSDGGGLDKNVMMQYVKLQAETRLRQLSFIASDLSVHLPAASPVLLSAYFLPSRRHDPLRRLLKYAMTLTAVSWMQSEATKYRRLNELPCMKDFNLRSPDLPPFLPEVWDGTIQANKDAGSKSEGVEENSKRVDDSSHPIWGPLQSFGTISTAYKNWLEGRENIYVEMHHRRREETERQLLNSTFAPSKHGKDTGYALITGASGGIGRAIAVELARYRIPVILVARDVSKLNRVAKEFIHESEENISRMLELNIGSTTKLTRHFARDMSFRRRGRIVFVSSMAGVLPGCPQVAVYAASKAYIRSLSCSLSRELEGFGVGVTCLLPGAVKETSFATANQFEDAVCFQVPGYATTVSVLDYACLSCTCSNSSELTRIFEILKPQLVASRGIKSAMLGYPECCVGWMNRIFLAIGQPMLPMRINTILAEFAWSPYHSPGYNTKKRAVDNPPEALHTPMVLSRLKRNSRLLALPEQLKESTNVTSSGSASVSSNSSVADILVEKGVRDGDDLVMTDGSNKTDGLHTPFKEKADREKLLPSMIAKDYDFHDRRLFY
ncbi:hypothetical protein THAOC_08463 [Thalassiosira oceanica]|uniref:Ketoreductase (KR) domain-containing protein n=1 Tax=Thalassiosira oceanica TaxID=159749 RepID=K0SZ16_THAOC|nr:hypothetical protein THAOC_08463 [Thalassiosira oceanica]|eukprot:EJK70199.1 hypothetical protein THAOC_08463 [Thalassiosira oceanica]